MKTYISSKNRFAIYLIISSIILIPVLSGCEKEKTDPALEMINASAVAISKYSASAKIIQQGDYEIFDYGFSYYFGPSENQYYSATKISLGKKPAQSEFSTEFSTQSYYYGNEYKCFIRAYITNEKGTIYSKSIATEIAKLTLTKIEPNTGKPGDTVTLTGSFFNPNPKANIVEFYYSSATVISGTTNSLRVIVPEPYYSENPVDVSVEYDSYQSMLNDAFTYIVGANSFSPHNGSWNNYITITGFGMVYAELYFDNTYITTNYSSSSNFSASIPSSFLKKQFKLYLKINGTKTEIPGGYFTMNTLEVDPLSNSQYSRGASVYLYGSNFNPSESYTKLLLGANTINSYNCYSTYASFTIPYSIALGTYTAKVTNSLDTVILANPIKIVAD